MTRLRAFVSFDLDHDKDLRTHLFDQAATDASRFIVVDWSIREVAPDWEDKTRGSIANVDLLLVICGDHTATAPGVNREIRMAQELRRAYYLLDGRPGRSQSPADAQPGDAVLAWNPGTWRDPAPSTQRDPTSGRARSR
jgi:hypothetical protein